VTNTLFRWPSILQVCQAVEGHQLICRELLQVAVQNAMKNVLKNQQRGLLKEWSGGTGAWISKYSKEIVQLAAQQLGVEFGDAIRATAGLNDGVCFTIANNCNLYFL
jgi:hypothetical protein